MGRTRRNSPPRRYHETPKSTYITREEYDRYMKSPEWETTRQTIFAERGYCEVCSTTKRLTLHHLTYSRNGKSILGREHRKDLMVLCYSCHMTWERVCKRYDLTPEVIVQVKVLRTYRVPLEQAFVLAVSPQCAQVLAEYREAKQLQLNQETVRNVVGKIYPAVLACLSGEQEGIDIAS